MSRFVALAPYVWHLQDAGSGPCILFLHGAAASTHTWRDILPALADKARVVALDMPGQGFTRAGTLTRCSLTGIADDIRALLTDQRIVPDIVVGHSAGGAIALRLALDLNPAPRQVIAVNPALGGFRGPAGAFLPFLAKMLAVVPGPASIFARSAASPERVRRLIESTGSKIDDRGLEFYRCLLSDPTHVAATLAMMARWDLSEVSGDLHRLGVPTRFILGRRDRAVPPTDARLAAAANVAIRVGPSPELGHLLHEEDPAVLLDVMERCIS